MNLVTLNTAEALENLASSLCLPSLRGREVFVLREILPFQWPMWWTDSSKASTISESQGDNFLKVKEYSDLTDRESKMSWRNWMSYKKTQKGNAICSGIKWVNRRDTLVKKRSKFLTKKKREGAILELENSINKMKNELVSAKNRADNMREN